MLRVFITDGDNHLIKYENVDCLLFNLQTFEIRLYDEYLRNYVIITRPISSLISVFPM